MNSIEIKTIRTDRQRRITLTEEDILELVRKATGEDLPIHAEVFVQVPGGGDWSNTSLDICNSTPLMITWTEVTEEQS